MSFGSSRRKVPWEEHQEWFARGLANEAQKIFIICSGEGESIGSVRLDRNNNYAATVSAYLGEQYTGGGLGVSALREACKRGFGDWTISRIDAWIRCDNTHSIRGFEKAGFQNDPDPDRPLDDHVLYTLERTPE
jgi:RimJ/RimL family protein N-acetyltransferase